VSRICWRPFPTIDVLTIDVLTIEGIGHLADAACSSRHEVFS
jgi:hypothetical protein